jgi:hypothetical protein
LADTAAKGVLQADLNHVGVLDDLSGLVASSSCLGERKPSAKRGDDGADFIALFAQVGSLHSLL